MAGGGLKLATLTELVELTGVNAFHGSLKRTGASNGEQKPVGDEWRHLGRRPCPGDSRAGDCGCFRADRLKISRVVVKTQSELGKQCWCFVHQSGLWKR